MAQPRQETVDNRLTETNREYEQRTLEVGAALPRYTSWLLEDFRPHLKGRVIEVGAGIGNISERWIGDVDEAVLVEPARNLWETLKGRVAEGKSHVHAVCGMLHEVMGKTVDGARIEPGTFDAALMVNVLEHIPDDEAVLADLYRLLKPGGALLIFVPAMPFLYGALDERVGHVRRYTKHTLSRVFEAAGFRIERMRYFDLLGMLPWFVTGRLLRRPTIGEGSAGFYDKVVVPICAFVDDVTRPRVGKNLIAIGRKAG
jgi:SAM-dependent methyltransferase